MLLGEAKHLLCLRESHSEKQAMVFPRDFIMILFEGRRSPGCLREGGERETASRIAWWGAEASIFRPLKNQPSPGFGTQLQKLRLWMKEEKWGQILCGLPGAKSFETERFACLTYFLHLLFLKYLYFN